MAECFLSLELTGHLGLSIDLEDSFAHNQRVEIRAIESEEQSIEFEVGAAELVHVCVGAAVNAEYPLNFLFDSTQTLTDCCIPVMDFETEDWKRGVYETWGEDVFDRDILIISSSQALKLSKLQRRQVSALRRPSSSLTETQLCLAA